MAIKEKLETGRNIVILEENFEESFKGHKIFSSNEWREFEWKVL